MKIEKHVLKDMQKIVDDPEKQKYADYVMLVLSGERKGDALKQVFPDRYARAIERAGGNSKVIGANIVKETRVLDRTKIVRELYEQGHKSWWIAFLEKKQKLYENLFDMAMDKDVIPRDRIAASKVALEHMPVFQEDIKVVHEVKENKEQFKDKLRDMRLTLHKAANEPIDVEAIDAEVEDVEPSKA